jgi:RNA polymerase sigma factor (sigma-70 family)
VGAATISALKAGSLRPSGATTAPLDDSALVDRVRAGDDSAFEELYRRYRPRITAFVRGQLRDDARSEDVAQEAFFSALRRMRATDSQIAFKPWIYEIARNAAIDSYRRTSRAQEVSIHGDESLRPSDRSRLVGSRAPDSALLVKERWEHLRGAFDELPDTHHQVLIMRELEGLSYREIGERLDLSRPAVESVLFRARRRLEREYEELDTGRRCHAMRSAIARLAEQAGTPADERRLARHTRRCSSCRRWAHQFGVDPRAGRRAVAARAAALLPLPAFLRRRLPGVSQHGSGAPHSAPPLVDLLGPGTSQLGFALSERAAALVAAAALAGAGAGGALLADGHSAIHRVAPPTTAVTQKHRAAPARVLRRAPSGGRFERQKVARGRVKHSAPHFRSAPPSQQPARPVSGSHGPPPKGIGRPAPVSPPAGISEDLGLGDDGGHPGSRVRLDVGLVGALPTGLPGHSPTTPPGRLSPIATAAALPPIVAHGTQARRIH